MYASLCSGLPEGLPRLGELLEEIKGLDDEQARRIHLVALGDKFAERPDYNEVRYQQFVCSLSSDPDMPCAPLCSKLDGPSSVLFLLTHTVPSLS